MTITVTNVWEVDELAAEMAEVGLPMIDLARPLNGVLLFGAPDRLGG